MRELDFPIEKSAQSGRVWNCRHKLGPQPDCTYTTPCPACRGARNRRKGQKAQREARKALGVPTSKYASQNGHEENWRGCFRVEVKAGQQVSAMTTRFLAAEAQSNAAKSEGDARPFLFFARPDGMSDGLVCVRASVWLTHIAPLIDEYGGVI